MADAALTELNLRMFCVRREALSLARSLVRGNTSICSLSKPRGLFLRKRTCRLTTKTTEINAAEIQNCRTTNVLAALALFPASQNFLSEETGLNDERYK